MPSQRPSSRRPGLGQLTLVEHALCPLDPRSSLVSNLAYDTSYLFTDSARHTRQAKARITSPIGLSANDELYLWGLLALTLAHAPQDGELHATPHYCLRRLGLIDQHAQRGGQQYRHFAGAVERLALVRYRCDHFYDPVKGEHRKVSFGFFSYSLPIDPASSRAWRLVWDPIFFDLVRHAGGHYRFDLHVYRRLDPASRRLFLLLGKIFHRRRVTPAFDLRHLAVNVLGFSASLSTRDLKAKLRRCLTRLVESEVIADMTGQGWFQKKGPGQYSLLLHRGRYFERRNCNPIGEEVMDSPLVEPFRQIGFADANIRWLLRTYSPLLLREWVDITLAALERNGPGFFRKNAMAYYLDNVKAAARGQRTPPDWWHQLRKEEAARRNRLKPAGKDWTPPRDLPAESRAAFERVAEDIFGHFVAAGQPEHVARSNARKFAGEYLQHSTAKSPSTSSKLCG